MMYSFFINKGYKILKKKKEKRDVNKNKQELRKKM